MTFRLPLLMRLLISFAGGLVYSMVSLIPMLLVLHIQTETGILILFAIASFFWGVLAFVWQSTIKLVISRNGVEFHAHIYGLRTSWENISHITIVHSWTPYEKDLY